MRRLPLVILAAFVLALATATPARAAQPYAPSFHSFDLSRPAASSGVVASSAAVALASSGLASKTYSDAYGNTGLAVEYGTWTSPRFVVAGGFSELVASWNADTPVGTWIQIEMQATTDKGTTTKWYVMGEWAYDDSYFRRTSIGHQGDADGFIAIDTFFAKDHLMTAYQLRATLFRSVAASRSITPTLSFLGAVASDAPNLNPSVPSALGGAEGIELAVPAYSQEIHAGEYPQFDGGGEAWCSPTSTSMILGYWGKLPPKSAWSYVYKDYPKTSDAWVDYAARYVYDYHYQGAGNWPFNAAYAAHWGLRGFVTQLRSLNAALRRFADGDGLVLGSCNGFQILCEAGLLPGALTRNDHLEFRCDWIHMRVESEQSRWLRGLRGRVLRMPIAHGEGNYYVDAETHARLVANGRIALRYCDADGRVTSAANPNGALDNIAGISNERGNVLGLMPHPERCSESLLGGTDGLLVLAALDTALARPVLLGVAEN